MWVKNANQNMTFASNPRRPGQKTVELFFSNIRKRLRQWFASAQQFHDALSDCTRGYHRPLLVWSNLCLGG